MIANILGAVAAILKWLFSPEQIRKRKENDVNSINQKLRGEVVTGDADAVSARLDRLREKNRLRQGQQRSDPPQDR